MEKLHILSALKAYERKFPHRFHMPGHKGDRRFRRTFKQAGQDITELSFSDNLQDPFGVIRLAEETVARRLGARRSFFLTDGSTCGIYSMLYAVARRGKKIIVNRNAHKSVFNACELFGIQPVVLDQPVADGMMASPSAKEIRRRLEEHSDAIGVLLTYPDYYGVTFDLKAVREITEKKEKLLLIDGAHGGHFRFDQTVVYAGEYADLWVDGVHKTLPALTQAAILNVANDALLEDVADSVNRFRTTSPSYPVLASIEYAEAYMSERGRAFFPSLRKKINEMKSRLSAVGYAFLPNDDLLKLVVDMKFVGISSDYAEEYLMRKRIYLEMNDGRYLLFMLSPYPNMRSLRALERALKRLVKERPFEKNGFERVFFAAGERKIPYLQAVERDKSEWIPVERSAGRIAAVNAGSFPPCIPYVIAGEVITAENADLLKRTEHAFGVSDGKIKVVKENNER